MDMDFDTMMEQVADTVQAYVNTLKEVLPEDLGLDRRAGYRLYVDSTTIAVIKSSDSKLQYYGAAAQRSVAGCSTLLMTIAYTITWSGTSRKTWLTNSTELLH